MAFEVSNKDILNVIERVFKIRISFELANKIKDEFLDLREANQKSSYGICIDHQEIIAYNELHEQIEKNKSKISLIINVNSF